MTDNILTRSVLEMLAALQPVLAAFEIDFYLVGAIARDIHFAARPELASKRITNDIDIAIMLSGEEQFYAVKQALQDTGLFVAHETEAIKMFYGGLEIDLLPFGEIENEYREARIHQPRLFAIGVPGFAEVLPAVEQVTFGEGLQLKVCSLEGIVLLKLIAWDDKPSRVKDVTDIDHIISVYFDLNDMDIYSEYMDVMEIYDTNDHNYLQLVSARVIGRQIAGLLAGSPALKERVINIASGRPQPSWQALAAGLEDVHTN